MMEPLAQNFVSDTVNSSSNNILYVNDNNQIMSETDTSIMTTSIVKSSLPSLSPLKSSKSQRKLQLNVSIADIKKLNNSQLSQLTTVQADKIQLPVWEQKLLLELCESNDCLDKGFAIICEYAGILDRITYVTNKYQMKLSQLIAASTADIMNTSYILSLMNDLSVLILKLLHVIVSLRKLQCTPSILHVPGLNSSGNGTVCSVLKLLRSGYELMSSHCSNQLLQASLNDRIVLTLSSFAMHEIVSDGKDINSAYDSSHDTLYVIIHKIIETEERIASSYSSKAFVDAVGMHPVLRLPYGNEIGPHEDLHWFEHIFDQLKGWSDFLASTINGILSASPSRSRNTPPSDNSSLSQQIVSSPVFQSSVKDNVKASPINKSSKIALSTSSKKATHTVDRAAENVTANSNTTVTSSGSSNNHNKGSYKQQKSSDSALSSRINAKEELLTDINTAVSPVVNLSSIEVTSSNLSSKSYDTSNPAVSNPIEQYPTLSITLPNALDLPVTSIPSTNSNASPIVVRNRQKSTSVSVHSTSASLLPTPTRKSSVGNNKVLAVVSKKTKKADMVEAASSPMTPARVRAVTADASSISSTLDYHNTTLVLSRPSTASFSAFADAQSLSPMDNKHTTDHCDKKRHSSKGNSNKSTIKFRQSSATTSSSKQQLKYSHTFGSYHLENQLIRRALHAATKKGGSKQVIAVRKIKTWYKIVYPRFKFLRRMAMNEFVHDVLSDITDRVILLASSKIVRHKRWLRNNAAMKIQQRFRKWSNIALTQFRQIDQELRASALIRNITFWCRIVMTAIRIWRFMHAYSKRKRLVNRFRRPLIMEKVMHKVFVAYGQNMKANAALYMILDFNKLKRERYVMFKRARAAVCIQKYVRRMINVERINEKKHLLYMEDRIRYFMVKHNIRDKVRRRRQYQSCIYLIQRVWRGYRVRKSIFTKFDATIKIYNLFSRYKAFNNLKKSLRRVDRPMIITFHGLRNILDQAEGEQVRCKVQVWWNPLLHIVSGRDLSTILQNKQPQLIVYTELHNIGETESTVKQSRSNTVMGSLLSTKSNGSSSSVDKISGKAASSPIVRKNLECNFNDETIKIPGCHQNSIFKFDFLLLDRKYVTYTLFLSKAGELMYWGGRYSERTNTFTSTRPRGRVVERVEDRPIFEFSVTTGPAMRSKCSFARAKFCGNGPAKRSMQSKGLIYSLLEKWTKFFLCLDRDGLCFFDHKQCTVPFFVLPINHWKLIDVEVGSSTRFGSAFIVEDLYNVVVTSIYGDTILLRFQDVGTRIFWLEVLHAVYDHAKKSSQIHDNRRSVFLPQIKV